MAEPSTVAAASAAVKRPATGNRAPGRSGPGPNRGGGCGGRWPNTGGRGPRNGNNSSPYNKVAKSGVHSLDGRRLSFAEVEAYKQAGICFNCFDEQNPHRAAVCTAPKKPFQDGWVDATGQIVYTKPCKGSA
jgi:hypothetical protein